MVVWKQQNGFIYFDRIKEIFYVQNVSGTYTIYADKIALGDVNTDEEAERIFIRIVSAFTNGQVEVDPWD